MSDFSDDARGEYGEAVACGRLTPRSDKTFQEKLADIIIDAIVPPAGERAGETEIRTLQAITALIESDLIGEDDPERSSRISSYNENRFSFGNANRNALRGEQRSILHDTGEKR